MLGIFEIEVTLPVWKPEEVPADLKWAVNLKSTAIIKIVFEEGTNVVKATKEIYDALTDLGLTGS